MTTEHVWEQTGWEYDDSFFTCKNCHLKTNCRRGYPAKTVEECQLAGIVPCKGDKIND
jgi:hypothetical protein